MEVIIAGAGSIGLLLGSYLSEAGMDVTFYVRREEQVELIRAEGIQRINQDNTTDVLRVHARLKSEICRLRLFGLLLSNMQVSVNSFQKCRKRKWRILCCSFRMALGIWNS